jgi:hypothetical protein
MYEGGMVLYLYMKGAWYCEGGMVLYLYMKRGRVLHTRATPQAEVNDFICVKYALISQYSLNTHNKFNRALVKRGALSHSAPTRGPASFNQGPKN